jgi:hypothetical protein
MLSVKLHSSDCPSAVGAAMWQLTVGEVSRVVIHLQGQTVKKKTGTQHRIPEYLNVHHHLRENLKLPLSKILNYISRITGIFTALFTLLNKT